MSRIAISNLAWPARDEDAVIRVMCELSINGVEIAPTKVWASPLSATCEEVNAYCEKWAVNGIQIVALQSLLFGRPDLTIFGTSAKRAETLNYLCSIIRLAARLGAGVLVFGSPGNRKVNDLPQHAIDEIAIPFFRSLGEAASEQGVCFCIEPNPTLYSADFVTTGPAGIELVRRVDHPGFGLHLDAACMTLSGENAPQTLLEAGSLLRHFHVSAPALGQIENVVVNHTAIAQALCQSGYTGWISIEMREQSADSCITSVRQALLDTIGFYDTPA